MWNLTRTQMKINSQTYMNYSNTSFATVKFYNNNNNDNISVLIIILHKFGE